MSVRKSKRSDIERFVKPNVILPLKVGPDMQGILESMIARRNADHEAHNRMILTYATQCAQLLGVDPKKAAINLDTFMFEEKK